jgi:hypothetical protein
VGAAVGVGSAGGGGAERGRGRGWDVVLEVATAWAVVKALLPLRIVGCVWATPWFARVGVVPVLGFVRRVVGRSKVS